MKTCKDRCKLCHINQTGQITAWKETCSEFIKYEKYRLWATIHGFYWDFCSARISFQEKTWWKSSQWPSLIVVLCNALTYIYIYICIYIYIYEIYKSREVYRHYIHIVWPCLSACNVLEIHDGEDLWKWSQLMPIVSQPYHKNNSSSSSGGGVEPPTKFSKRGWAWQDLNG